MRRTLLVAAGSLSAVALVVVAVFALNGDDETAITSATTTTATGAGQAPADAETTTTEKGAPVTSGGAAPVSGAILSQAVTDTTAVDVGEETDCRALDAALDPVSCTREKGSGGEFLVFVGRRGDGALRGRLYRSVDGAPHTFTPVRQSAFFEPDADVAGMSLVQSRVGGEPVIVVDYDFGGSGGVHSFDVVAWDSSDEGPRVVAFVNGTGGDRAVPSAKDLRFVGANYEDGSPTCCPNFADVRTLTHAGPGRWEISTETVPFSEAP